MYEKFLLIIKRAHNEDNFFLKKKEFINNRAAGMIMKIQKSVIFTKKNLKINIWQIKNIVKLEIIVFHNGSNHDYHFITRKLAE